MHFDPRPQESSNRPRGLGLARVGLALALIGGVARGAPLYLDVTGALPGLPGEPTAGVVACDGSLRCVDGVIREMTRRWAPLDRRCDHDAVFALTYLLTTLTYRAAVEDPGYFADNAFVNNEDRAFADLYFAAYDAWHDGDRATVPAAWAVAFDASDRGRVTGTGNLLLGMNAHIQRDLPFVLVAIGLVGPDGQSRKPDHDRVNAILNQVTEIALREAAERYDPTIADLDVPGTTLDATAFNLMIQGWREAAWRNAERLTAARTAWARRQVAQDIERAAWLEAVVIATATQYDGVVQARGPRDAWCEGRAAEATCEEAALALDLTLGDLVSAETWAALQVCGAP